MTEMQKATALKMMQTMSVSKATISGFEDYGFISYYKDFRTSKINTASTGVGEAMLERVSQIEADGNLGVWYIIDDVKHDCEYYLCTDGSEEDVEELKKFHFVEYVMQYSRITGKLNYCTPLHVRAGHGKIALSL